MSLYCNWKGYHKNHKRIWFNLQPNYWRNAKFIMQSVYTANTKKVTLHFSSMSNMKRIIKLTALELYNLKESIADVICWDDIYSNILSLRYVNMHLCTFDLHQQHASDKMWNMYSASIDDKIILSICAQKHIAQRNYYLDTSCVLWKSLNKLGNILWNICSGVRVDFY